MLFVSGTFSKWFCQEASMKINSEREPRSLDLPPLRFSYFFARRPFSRLILRPWTTHRVRRDFVTEFCECADLFTKDTPDPPQVFGHGESRTGPACLRRLVELRSVDAATTRSQRGPINRRSLDYSAIAIATASH